jgi:hypothetical protein
LSHVISPRQPYRELNELTGHARNGPACRRAATAITEGLLMPREHWFDTLLKAMHGVSRRDIARGGAMLLPGLLVGGLTDPAVAGKKRKKKGKKGKGNGKKPHKPNKPNKPDKPKPPAEPDICDATWPGPDQQDDRDWCRFIRRQCPPGGSRDFCIIELELDRAAFCCEGGETCCGGWCCAADEQCRDNQCVCEAPDCARACSDFDCPEGQRCILNDQYYCDGDSSPDCECGCGLNYEYKQCRDGWRCVSQGANC